MIRVIILLLLISSCTFKKENIKKELNFENFDYDKNISIEEFKEKLVIYGESSNYPDINK